VFRGWSNLWTRWSVAPMVMSLFKKYFGLISRHIML